LAFNVVVSLQTPKSGPAFAAVGAASRTMLMVSLVVAHTPLLIIHSNKFEPTLNPVTPEAGSAGIVTLAPPESTTQVPVPVEGTFPARVADVEQTV
jgi:hypothetical protein